MTILCWVLGGLLTLAILFILSLVAGFSALGSVFLGAVDVWRGRR